MIVTRMCCQQLYDDDHHTQLVTTHNRIVVVSEICVFCRRIDIDLEQLRTFRHWSIAVVYSSHYYHYGFSRQRDERSQRHSLSPSLSLSHLPCLNSPSLPYLVLPCPTLPYVTLPYPLHYLASPRLTIPWQSLAQLPACLQSKSAASETNEIGTPDLN